MFRGSGGERIARTGVVWWDLPEGAGVCGGGMLRLVCLEGKGAYSQQSLRTRLGGGGRVRTGRVEDAGEHGSPDGKDRALRRSEKAHGVCLAASPRGCFS